MVRRWDPFKDIAHLREMMSRLLDEEVQHRLGAGQSVQSDWTPSVDLVELENKFILKADMAGMARKDIKVEVVEAQLILKGERKINKPGEGEKYFRLERPYGKFCRIFPLPAEVNCGGVHATLKDGVLEVTLPKAEKHQSRKITIKCEVE